MTANLTRRSLPGCCRWRLTWKWIRTRRVSPEGISFSNPQAFLTGPRGIGAEVNTRQLAERWSTRGFNSRAVNNRAGVFESDASVTCQWVLICVINWLLPSFPTAHRYCEVIGTKRRSKEDRVGLGLARRRLNRSQIERNGFQILSTM